MVVADMPFDGHRIPPEEPGKWLSLAFTIFMHGLLALLLYYSVQWQSHPVGSVEVELVRSLPEAPPKLVAPPPAPVPQPVPEEKQPEPVKPDIVLERKPPKKIEAPKPEPKPEPKKDLKKEAPRAETRPVAPAPLDDRLQRMLTLDANKARDDARVRAELEKQHAAVESKVKADAASAAFKTDTDAWTEKIKLKVTSKFDGVVPPDVKGRPSAEVSLELLPDMSVVEGSVKLTKSTGNDLLDKMVIAAVYKASPLPPPANAAVYQRNLRFIFWPLGK